MPTLHWIGKDKVINHHLDVPFRVLEHGYGFHNGEKSKSVSGNGNRIIHGDNLEALKALLPEYEGKIKCIYIDPPYNTGNEGWVYNDNVNDPKIKKWLHELVGKEGEDLTRHDKWLCMMYPRLKLLHKLLADDGAIFISIDDNEQANLRLLMDEIFGSKSFIGKISWYKKRKGSFLSKEFIKLTEYIFAYRKNSKLQLYGGTPNSEESQPLVKRTNSIGVLKFPVDKVSTKLKDGVYKAGTYGKGSSSVKLLKNVEVKNSKFLSEIELEAPFTWSQDFLNNELDKETEIVINTINFQPRAFRKSEDKHKGFPSFVDGREFSGTSDDAYDTLKEIFVSDRVFEYSKPYQLISFLLNSITHFDKNSIILDSFAGSGTTAHAVLNLNKQDGGNRKFILIEMENYAETITAERAKRVIGGYADKEGTGGSFDYYTLGQPIFTEEGMLNESVPVKELHRYIFYTETRQALPDTATNKDNPFLLGLHNQTAYYFFYEPGRGTTLDHDFLATIRTKAEEYIIYADNCTLTNEYLTMYAIRFKKIPRDIARF